MWYCVLPGSCPTAVVGAEQILLEDKAKWFISSLVSLHLRKTIDIEKIRPM